MSNAEARSISPHRSPKMTEKEELAPCLVCGKQPKESSSGLYHEFTCFHSYGDPDDDIGGVWVTARCDTREQAAEAWNNRSTPPARSIDAGDGWVLPDDCDGIEQDAFEAWAAAERYDMEQHPLHWLFLDAQTAAARNGWRAGIRHARDRYRAMLAAAPPPAAKEAE